MPHPVVIAHPLVAHKLSLMRDKKTPSAQFRTLLREISLLLGYEVLRDLPLEQRPIETPVGPTRAPFLKGKKLVFVPIFAPAPVCSTACSISCRPRGSVTSVSTGIRRPWPPSNTTASCRKTSPTPNHRRRSHAGNRQLRHRRHRSPQAPGRARHPPALPAGAPEGIAALAAAHPEVPIYTAAIDAAA